MKKLLLIASLFFATTWIVPFAHADEYVNGYTKADGTYVNSYYRSSPDGDPYNNFSYPGNTNPYTGVTAGGNPETYLKYNDPGYTGIDDSDSSGNSSYDNTNYYSDPAYNTDSSVNTDPYSSYSDDTDNSDQSSYTNDDSSYFSPSYQDSNYDSNNIDSSYDTSSYSSPDTYSSTFPSSDDSSYDSPTSYTTTDDNSDYQY